MINVGPVVSLLASDIIEVTTCTGGYDSAGVYQLDPWPVPPPTRQLRCSVQPTSGKDLERVPEGQRINASITVYSRESLTLGAVPAVVPDRFTWRGQEYAAIGSSQWDSAGYWRTVLVKVEV